MPNAGRDTRAVAAHHPGGRARQPAASDDDLEDIDPVDLPLQI